MSALLPASPDGHPELAVAWVLHALEPDEDAEFAEHLADCAGCRRIVEETEEVATLLGSAVEPAETAAGAAGRGSWLRRRPIWASPHPEPAKMPACVDRLHPVAGSPFSPAHPPVDATSDRCAAVDGVLDDGRRRWARRATAGLAVAAALALVVAIGGLVAREPVARRASATPPRAAARGEEVVQLLDAAARPGDPARSPRDPGRRRRGPRRRPRQGPRGPRVRAGAHRRRPHVCPLGPRR